MKVHVRGFLTHPNLHVDESAAVVNLQLGGHVKYTGIPDARLHFVGNPKSVNADEMLKKGYLCIGVGGGIYDEHNTGRYTCCAELVAEDLGMLENNPAMQEFISWIRHGDRTDDVGEYELSRLVKFWHRVADPMRVFNMARQALFDSYRHLRGDARLGQGAKAFTFGDLAMDFRSKFGNDCVNHRGLGRIHRAIVSAETATLRPLDLFNIIRVWQELYPLNVQTLIVRGWAKRHLFMLGEQAIRFQQVFDAYQQRFRRFEDAGKSGHTFRCAIHQTDDRDIPTVARNKGADIVIVQNSKGNIQIITQKRRNKKAGEVVRWIDLSKVAEVLRRLELLARHAARPERYNDDEYWQQPETMPEVPQWYFLEPSMLLNGSNQSSEEVEPTKLTLETVYNVVRDNAVLRRKERQEGASAA